MAAGEERRKQAVQARITRVQRHLNLEVFMRAAVGPAWVAITVFVVWRIFVQKGLFVVGPLALVLGAVVTWLLVRNQGVSHARAAVIADRQADAGGLLLTRLEMPVGDWELGLNQQLKTLPLPEIQLRRPAAMIGLALCFLLVGLLVPQAQSVLIPPNAAAATRVEELAEKMEAIAKEEPAEEAALAELQRLQEELADNAFDAADWEAADALEQQLDKQAAEASRELERAENAAKNLENAMANAQSGESEKRERDELEQALMDLSDGQANSGEQAMEQAMGEGENGKQGENGAQEGQGKEGQEGQGKEGQGKEGQGKEGQGKEGQGKEGQGKEGQGKEGQGKEGQQNGPSKSGPSSKQVSDLRKALAQRQEQLSKQFSQGNSPQAKRSSSSKSQKGEGKGEGQGEGKGEGQGEGQGKGQTGGQDGQHASRGMEEGGVGRGGDAQELVFGGNAEMDPDRLKYEALPEGNGGEGDELFGLRATNPKKNSDGTISPATGLGATGDQAAGYDEGAMRPRNRALVQRYFDSK